MFTQNYKKKYFLWWCPNFITNNYYLQKGYGSFIYPNFYLKFYCFLYEDNKVHNDHRSTAKNSILKSLLIQKSQTKPTLLNPYQMADIAKRAVVSE